MKFKNISEHELSVPGVGIIKPGETVEMPAGFHNANFEQEKNNKDLKTNINK